MISSNELKKVPSTTYMISSNELKKIPFVKQEYLLSTIAIRQMKKHIMYVMYCHIASNEKKSYYALRKAILTHCGLDSICQNQGNSIFFKQSSQIVYVGHD